MKNDTAMTKNKLEDWRIPIVIGVTGHRNLRAEDGVTLERSVKEILLQIQDKHPYSPLLVLTSLAEGADRLVAEVAHDLGIPFIVPLPMSVEEYEMDFSSPASLTEFRDLLGKAQRWFELPIVEGKTMVDIRSDKSSRNYQYLQAGAYIAFYSQILIALWDGVAKKTSVGTSRVVEFMLNGIPEPFVRAQNRLDHPDTGQVFHIVTPRISATQPAEEAGKLLKMYPEVAENNLESEFIHKEILGKIDQFNHDAARFALNIEGKVRENKSQLIPVEQVESLTDGQKVIVENYAVSDTLAAHFQTKSRRALTSLLSFVVIGFVFFQLYLELLKHPYLLLFYPLALAVAFLLYFLAWRRDYQNKYLDYRALAEGLRVSLFWDLSGIKEDVAEFYLRKQKSELEWIRQAIRNISIKAGISISVSTTSQPTTSSGAVFDLVMKQWVNHQRDWFKKRTVESSKKHKKEENIANTLYWIGIGLAVAMLIVHSYILKLELLQHVMIISIAVCLVLAATVSGYIEKAAYSEHFKQYNRMRDVFRRGSLKATDALDKDNIVEVQEIIKELGKEALSENGDWVLLHRSKPIGVPKG